MFHLDDARDTPLFIAYQPETFRNWRVPLAQGTLDPMFFLRSFR